MACDRPAHTGDSSFLVLLLSPLLKLGELCIIELAASTAGVSVVCGFVVLVLLKFIEAQGKILKIKLKDL